MDGPDPQTLGWLQWLGVVLTPVAWATHIAIAVAMQSLVALAIGRTRLSNPWWIGAAFATAYAYSREKTEFEFHLKAINHLRTVGPYWYRGFIPLEWDLSSQFQFYAPAAAVILLALAIDRRAR
ncbi:MAG TPA: hypothetical protein VL899_13875 [Alphaproteobacteria bacterium]|nr:hypothetical protein [Alphaproteobacteria bacterium]